MPHTRPKSTILYTFLLFQLFLNVIFTNGAVIGREKREISANVSGITPANNEVSFATTEQAPRTTLLGTGSHDGSITTDVSGGKKESTTLTGSTVDENTVSFSIDDHGSGKDEDSRVKSTKIWDERTQKQAEGVVLSEETTASNDKSGKEPEITTGSESNTASESMLKGETTTLGEVNGQSSAKMEVTTVLRSTADESSTVRMTVDSATTVIGAKTDEVTDSKTVDEELPQSTVKNVPTTDVTTGKALAEATDVITGKSSDDIAVTIGAKLHLENGTNDSLRHQSTADVSSTTKSEFQNGGTIDKSEVTTRLVPTDTSATSATNEQSNFMTETSHNEPSSTQSSKNLTSTGKSDETTVILTSTEMSDENPLQTTDFASTHSQDSNPDQEIKNSTPPLSEKRGKFIDDNYSSANELHLPNNSDVWALAGMKTSGRPKSSELQNSVETSDEKAVNNSMVTKSLLDWSRVMMTTDSMESVETTIKLSDSTTNDRPEGQATTEIRIQGENERDTSTKQSKTNATSEAATTTDSKKVEIEVDTSTKKPPLDTTSEAVKVSDRMNVEESTSHTTAEVVDLTDRMDVEENTRDTAAEAVNLTDRMDIEESTANQSTNEAETKTPSKTGTTTEDIGSDDELLKDIDDTISITATPESLLKGHVDSHFEDNQLDGDSTEEELPLATTTKSSTTPIPVKSETTISGETAIEGGNTGKIATSTLSHFDFTTSVPFLTSTMTTIKTTPEQFAFNMDDRTSEAPNKASTTLTPPGSGQEATVESTTTTTTTTPIPAVTVMPATTETQTIEAVAHTPTIISNNDTMTQKSSSDSNYYNNYDVGTSTPTTTTPTTTQNSSVETFEVSTRVAPSNWAVSTPTEVVARLDDSDVTTASNFDSNNNAYEIIVTPETSSTTGSTLTFATPTTVIRSTTAATTVTEDLDSIHKISETSLESNVIDPLHVGEASTTTTTTAATTTDTSQENMRMQSTGKGGLVDFTTTTTTTSTTVAPDDSTTTLQSISTKKEDVYSIVPTIDNGGYYNIPKVVEDDATTTTIAGVLSGTMDGSDAGETDVNVIIAISVSAVGIVALILLVAFLYVMRKRQKQMSYGQRCRPVSLDAYSLDNVSVYNSVRRKGATLRASKRSYGNVAFDDPSLRHNVLGTHELAKYVEKKSSIWEEFKDVPQIIARADEVPAGCEDKNRYANVIPLPETRVILQQQNGDEKSEYINANYVRGPKDTTNYYIACQAPLETTVTDFWRMIWEQNSRVIIMATDLIENGIDKCAEYLPPSVTLDNHTVFGDYQVTLKNREVKEKYAISTLMLKNTATEESREITHYWYQWPEAGVPTDEAAVIAMLLEARSSLKMYTIEPSDIKTESTIITEDTKKSKTEINGNVAPEKLKPPPRDQGPLTIHCSPGTGRTGTILACDIAMRCLEEPKRSVDIPQIVYSVRRGRASAVQTKEQYEFIYKVTHMYATKITNINNDN